MRATALRGILAAGRLRALCTAPDGLVKLVDAARPGRLDPAFAERALHAAPEAVVLACPLGTIRSWNTGAEEMFGWAAAEVVGASLTDLLVPERHRRVHDAGYAKVMAGGEAKYGRHDLLRVPALCKDGTRKSVEFSLQLIRGAAGQPVGSLALMRDVTPSSEHVRKLRTRIAELERIVALADAGLGPLPPG
jgi:PAS domain S-box-containing protein